MKKIILSLALTLVVFGASVSGTFAAGGIVPSECRAGLNGTCNLCKLFDLAKNFTDFLMFDLAIPIVILALLYGGFVIIMSGGDTKKVEEGRKIVTNAVVGTLVAFLAWVGINTIVLLLGVQFTGVSGAKNWYTFPSCSELNKIVAPITPPPGGSGGPGGPAGSQKMMVMGPDGQLHEVAFDPTQSDAALQAGYDKVQSQYGSEIRAACQGSNIPNCEQVTTALIAAESGGNATTGCNSSGACGVMQLLPENGGRACAAGDSACISEQINIGVQHLNNTYNNTAAAGNIPNTVAAYNGGASTRPGSSPGGKNPAMAPSNDCPGLYAWQCNINPGGLDETQGYTASICRNLERNGGSCN